MNYAEGAMAVETIKPTPLSIKIAIVKNAILREADLLFGVNLEKRYAMSSCGRDGCNCISKCNCDCNDGC